MEPSLPYRVVRRDGEEWVVRPEEGEWLSVERQELKAYLEQAGLSCHFDHGRASIPGNIVWDLLYERLSQFYAGRAEVIPF